MWRATAVDFIGVSSNFVMACKSAGALCRLGCHIVDPTISHAESGSCGAGGDTKLKTKVPNRWCHPTIRKIACLRGHNGRVFGSLRARALVGPDPERWALSWVFDLEEAMRRSHHWGGSAWRGWGLPRGAHDQRRVHSRVGVGAGAGPLPSGSVLHAMTCIRFLGSDFRISLRLAGWLGRAAGWLARSLARLAGSFGGSAPGAFGVMVLVVSRY